MARYPGLRLLQHGWLAACVLGVLFLAGFFYVPSAFASPGCQALNGLSGTLGTYGYVEFLANNQPVNQGDAVTVTSSGLVSYIGSFIQLSYVNGTMSGVENGSGAGADGIENLGTGTVSYSITCRSVAPTVSGISPGAGSAGTSVTITGTGFYGTTAVMFGGTPATSFTIDVSGDLITATAPSGTSTAPVSVTTDAGTASGGLFTLSATAGLLSEPLGVTSDGGGNLYIADAGLSYIVRVPTGCSSQSCEAQLGSGFSSPAGVAVDGGGNVFTINSGTGDVVEIPWNAGTGIFGTPVTLLSSLNLSSGRPAGIAVDSAGNVYATDTGNHQIWEVPWTGSGYGAQKSVFQDTSYSPTGVAVDGNGNLYVADGTEKFSVIEVSGTTTKTLVDKSGVSGTPYSVAVGNGGNLYYSDAASGTLTMLPWSGTAFGTAVQLGSGWSALYGLTVDGAGNVYGANSGAKNILKLTLTTPPSLSFAATAVGATSTDSPKSVTLQNIGNAALTFPTPSSGMNPNVSNNFSYGNGSTCPQLNPASAASVLPPGASCTVAIDFTPTAAGSLSGTAVLTNDNLNAPAPNYTWQSIGLSGTAIRITLTPAAGALAAATLGTAYSQQFSGGGGTAPYSFSSTDLPPWLTLSPSGMLSGTPTPAGSYSFIVTAVDSNSATFSQSYSVTVTQATPVVSATAPVLTYGQSASSTVTVTGVSGLSPTGTVSWAIDRGTPQIVTLISGAATIPVPMTLTSGSHIIALTYNGDTNYRTATGTVPLTVGTATLTIAANNIARAYGTENPAFAGTVTGEQNGDTFTESFATTAVISSPVGAYAIVPSVTGANLANYTQSISGGTLTVTQAPTTTTLQVSGTSAAPGQNVTLTAAVASMTSGIPTGSVNFYDNGVLLNTPAVLAGGVATLATAALSPQVSHTITASYSGDGNFTASRSTASAATTITLAPLDFTMTVTGPSKLTIAPGQKAGYQVRVTPDYGSYAGTISFAAAGLPPGATVAFSPSTIAANGGPQTITVTIRTAAITALLHREPPMSHGYKAAPTALGFLLLLGGGTLRKRGKVLRGLLGVLVLIGAVGGAMTISGCGAGTGFFTQAPQNYTVTITATTGNLQHTSTITLSVQ